MDKELYLTEKDFLLNKIRIAEQKQKEAEDRLHRVEFVYNENLKMLEKKKNLRIKALKEELKKINREKQKNNNKIENEDFYIGFGKFKPFIVEKQGILQGATLKFQDIKDLKVGDTFVITEMWRSSICDMPSVELQKVYKYDGKIKEGEINE